MKRDVEKQTKIILELVRNQPDISRSDIIETMRRFGVSRSTVHNRLVELREQGVLVATSHGRNRLTYKVA